MGKVYYEQTGYDTYFIGFYYKISETRENQHHPLGITLLKSRQLYTQAHSQSKMKKTTLNTNLVDRLF